MAILICSFGVAPGKPLIVGYAGSVLCQSLWGDLHA